MRNTPTAAEWAVLCCLWEAEPQTLMQLAARLHAREGWAKSTTTTMLRRMQSKGLVRAEPNGRGKRFYANVRQDDARSSETARFLSRVYQGSVGLMLSAMTSRQALSQAEIDELQAILQQAEERMK